MSRGFTLVEIAVGMSLFLLVGGLMYGFYGEASLSTQKTTANSDALRSCLIAMEALRRDTAQMLFQDPPRDLSIFDQNRAISLRVPSIADTGDLWSAVHVPVSYSLRPVPGSAGAHWLVRKDGQTGTETVLKGCLLADMLIAFVPRGDISPLQAYLEITLLGMGSASGGATYTASMLLPLPLMGTAGRYALLVKER